MADFNEDDDLNQILEGRANVKQGLYIIALELRSQRRQFKGTLESFDKRIKSFEDARKWLITTVAGVLILALLSLVVVVRH